MLFLDLDRFRVVNDSLGHAAGDQLLIMVAARLNACGRAEDTVARFGGDEFAILLGELATSEDVLHVAERINQELDATFHLPPGWPRCSNEDEHRHRHERNAGHHRGGSAAEC